MPDGVDELFILDTPAPLNSTHRLGAACDGGPIRGMLVGEDGHASLGPEAGSMQHNRVTDACGCGKDSGISGADLGMKWEE